MMYLNSQVVLSYRSSAMYGNETLASVSRQPPASAQALPWCRERQPAHVDRRFHVAAPRGQQPGTPFCLSSGNLGGVDFSAALSDEREDLSGEITLQGSNGVEFGMPFRDPTSNIVLGSLIGS